MDVQEQEESADKPSPRGAAQTVSADHTDGLRLPEPEAVARAAALLNGAQRVAILAGRGALHARAELEQTAQLLGAPVAKALLGKAVLPDDHPLTTGGIGLYGTFGTHAAMAKCDALLIVGSTFPYVEYYPKPGQARCVQIDRDPQRISLRVAADVGLVGDARASLEMLNAQLQRKEDRSFLERAQGEARRWTETLRAAEESRRTPMHPAVPVAALNRRLPPDAVVVTDSGHHTGLVARHVAMRPGHDFAVSGLLASMASGLPYAIAAGLAFPGRPVFAVVGDGGLAMQLGEFATAVQHRLNLKLLVIRNGTLGQIKWEQMLFLGNPEFACEVPPIDFARAAEAMGGHGFTVDDPAQADAVLDRALATEGPAIIQAIVDPNEPLLPAVVSETYKEHLRKALGAGTPGRNEIERALEREPSRSMMRGRRCAVIRVQGRCGNTPCTQMIQRGRPLLPKGIGLPCRSLSRRSGRAKLTWPSPPYCVPRRAKSACHWLIGSTLPSQSMKPRGANGPREPLDGGEILLHAPASLGAGRWSVAASSAPAPATGSARERPPAGPAARGRSPGRAARRGRSARSALPARATRRRRR